MTYKERLNSILRLRLFYSTEAELGERVGLKLKGNHFNHQKDFACEAYFCKFAEECREQTSDTIDLAVLLRQYEATSEFFKQYVEGTAHESSKAFVPCLLNYLYLGESKAASASDGIQRNKSLMLCERYDAHNANGELNPAILFLLTHGIIPTFTNKSAQDIPDIAGDFQQAYNALSAYARDNRQGDSTVYKEILCLKEMRKLTEDGRNGYFHLNRIVLIHLTCDVINRIYALKLPERLRAYTKEHIPMDFRLPRFFRAEGEPENIVWEFEMLDNIICYLYRYVIDSQDRQIRFTRYQMLFKDLGYRDMCFSLIMRPEYVYNMMLKRELDDHAITFDYTDIGYGSDGYTVSRMSFTEESPLGEKPLTLRAATANEAGYYEMHIDKKGRDYELTCNQPQYHVECTVVETAVSNDALIFNFVDEVYRLDKRDEEGNETIPGICSLTHTDNFVYAQLVDDGATRCFLCLDSINQNLDIDDLLTKPYFHRLKQVSEVFAMRTLSELELGL